MLEGGELVVGVTSGMAAMLNLFLSSDSMGLRGRRGIDAAGEKEDARLRGGDAGSERDGFLEAGGGGGGAFLRG
jgi:hypothetical protein